MPKTKTDDAKAREALAAISPQFAAALETGETFDAVVPAPQPTTKRKDPVLAPVGVDPHEIPAADIVFDPALLDGVDLSTPDARSNAVKAIFPLYKSPPRVNKDRNRLLHDRIGAFVRQAHRSATTGTQHVKQEVRRTGKQRDLLALLAEHGITSVEDLQASLGGGA